MIRIVQFLSLFSALLAFSSFAQAAEKLYIVTTTAQVGDIAHNVAGPDAVVDSLMGPGVDPHLYRPTRSDIVKLGNADIIFYNGFHLEGQMVHLLEQMGRDKPSVNLGESLSKSRINKDETGAYDPHIWMDVKNWVQASEVIRGTLTRHDPGRTAAYDARAAAYKTRLEQLDSRIKAATETIPAGNRYLVTAHDAFGYLGSAYGLEVIGIQGLSTESEAGLERMEQLVDLIVRQKIPAIFLETSVSDRNIKALIEGSAARGHALKIGGSLFSDAMGPSGTYEGTYIGMMEYNVRAITGALGGRPDALTPDESLAVNAP